MRLVALLVAAVSCFAQGTRSIVFNGLSDGVRFTIPNASPYTALGPAMRFEWRMTNFRLAPPSRNVIFITRCAQAYIEAGSTNLTVLDGCENTTSVLDLSRLETTDALVRFSKFSASQTGSFNAGIVLEIWNPDGTGYASSCTRTINCPQVTSTATNWAGTWPIGFNSFSGNTQWYSGRIAWLRWYSSTVPAGWDSAIPANVPGGDLADFEFEGNTTDASSHALATSLVGSPTFITTPFAVRLPGVLTPAVGATTFQFSARSGTSFNLDASASGAATYTWTQTAGPACTLSNATSPIATATCNGFGQRTFHLSAKDVAAQTATGDVNVGIVVTDSRGVVQVSDPVWAFMLGPMTMYDVTGPSWSPWSFFERQRDYGFYYFYSSNTSAPAGAWPASWFAQIEAMWYYCSICSVYRQYFRSGLTIYQTQARLMGATVYGYSDGWNNGAGQGGCANQDFGHPRDSSAEGVIMWLYDTGGDLSTTGCAQVYADWAFGTYIEQNYADDTRNPTHIQMANDAREPAYAYMFGLFFTQLGNANMNGHGTWSSRVANAFNNFWVPYQCGNGTSFIPLWCGNTQTQISGTIATTNGSSTVVGTGTHFTTELKTGIIYARITNGGSGYTSAPTVTVHADGNGSACTGTVFAAPSISGGSLVTGTLAVLTNGTCGTSATGQGWSYLTFSGGGGSGAQGYAYPASLWFETTNVGCNGQTNQTNPGDWTVNPIVSITDDTHLTLGGPAPSTVSGCAGVIDTWSAPVNDTGAIRWFGAPIISGGFEEPWLATMASEGVARYYLLTNDANALAWLQRQGTHIATDAYNNAACQGTTLRTVYYSLYQAGGAFPSDCNMHDHRALTDTVPHLFGWLFRFTGDASWLTYGDNYFSALFGDSGSGPGTDGWWGQFDPIFQGKFQGQSLRSADAYLANRLLGANPLNRPLFVALNPGLVPAASQFQVSLTASDGSTVSNTCSSSPCTITVNAAGQGKLQINYLNGSSVVASTASVPIPIPVQ